MLSTIGKNSADDALKYLPYFTQKTGFDGSCKLFSTSHRHYTDSQESGTTVQFL